MRIATAFALGLFVSACSEPQPAAPANPTATATATTIASAPAPTASAATSSEAPKATTALTAKPFAELPPVKGSVRGQEVSYEAGGVKLKGFLAYDTDKKGKRPGVLIVHEWWGHTSYVRKRATMLAALGYTAFALDMYGDGKNTAHPDDAKKFAGATLSNLDAAKARFIAAKELLEKHDTTDAEKTAAIGYCFGGGVVLHMARIGVDLDGVVSFHGSLGSKAPDEKTAIKVPILVLHGAADPFVPAEQVDAFKKEMKARSAPLEFVAYPGVKHAFTNPGATALGAHYKLPLAYDADADKKSWAAMQKFLHTSFTTDR